MAAPCRSHDVVAGMTPATPEKIEDTLKSMRVRILRIISCWEEQSGQGEDGTDNQEEELPDHVNVEANDDDNSHAASALGNERQRYSHPRHHHHQLFGEVSADVRLVRSKNDWHS